MVSKAQLELYLKHFTDPAIHRKWKENKVTISVVISATISRTIPIISMTISVKISIPTPVTIALSQ